jgi:hypothetical protein
VGGGKNKVFIKPLALGWIGGQREKVRGVYRALIESLTLLSQRLNARRVRVLIESLTLLSQRLNARPGGEYGFSSLMKQNKKGKICFVIYIAGFFF